MKENRLKAIDKLEQARKEINDKKAMKLAKEALKLDETYIEAKLFLLDFEQNITNIIKQLVPIIKEEEEKLRKENFFEEENIGSFYVLQDTRNFMIALQKYMSLNCFIGKMKIAKKVAESMLKLNESDNLAIRYFLGGIYIFLEEEENYRKLLEEFEEESVQFLLLDLILYYKKDDDNNIKVTLEKIKEINEDCFYFLVGQLEFDTEEMEIAITNGIFEINSLESMLSFMDNIGFVMHTVPEMAIYVSENFAI